MFAFGKLACTSVLCREIEDAERVARQLAERPIDLVFWPLLVGHPPGTVHPDARDTADLGYVRRAAAMASQLGSFVVQSNWPDALNTPDSTYLGESKVYGRDGDILITLPRDEPGIAVFELGDRHYDWQPIPY